MRAALGPVPALDDPPPISIVIINGNGRHRLDRVLPLLSAATDYPNIEVVVVDRGSDDGSLEYLDAAPVADPIAVEAVARDVPFSEALNRGAARASFDHLLFLSNAVEPFEPGWLRELAICMRRSHAAAVGATLLHGPRPNRVWSGHPIQHQGFRFRREDGCLITVDRVPADGGLEHVGTDVPSPGVTAACMLIPRSTFEQVGGFTPGFQHGYEDVDLGMKLVEAGGMPLYSGRSVLLHHGSSTRPACPARRDGRSAEPADRRLLISRWGPQLEREYTRDRVLRAGLWSNAAKPEIALTVGSDPKGEAAARGLGDALEERDWDVAYIERMGDGWGEPPAGADLVLVTDHRYGASLASGANAVGWILGDAEQWMRRPWLRHFQLLLAGDPTAAETLRGAGRHAVDFPADGDWEERATELADLWEARNERWRFCLRLPRARAGDPPDLRTLAAELRGELERRGHVCMLQSADEWERLDGLTADVVIGIGGRYVPKPAQLGVLWLAGPPDAEALSGRWDLIAVDTGPIADRARSLSPTPPLISMGLNTDGGVGRAVDRLLQALAEAATATGFAPSIATDAA